MMNQHLHSPTKLTEFARNDDDEPETFLGRVVNKLQNVYSQSQSPIAIDSLSVGGSSTPSRSTFYASPGGGLSPITGTSTTTATTPSGGNNLDVSCSSSPKDSRTRASSESPSTTSVTKSIVSNADLASDNTLRTTAATGVGERGEERTMVNVLKRISKLVATKNNDLRSYKDTDLQRFWMPDSKAKECYDCSLKFSTFRRKHHCRLCGQVFCSKCCNQEVPGRIINCAGNLKVCNYCSKCVLSYLESPNIARDLHSDLQALQQDLSSKLEENKDDNANARPSLPLPTPSREVTVGYQEERFVTHESNMSVDDRKNILQQSNSLITLHGEMQRSLPPQSCGTELIDFLNNTHRASNKIQALAILSAMLAAGFLQPIVPDSEQTEFDETLHYRLVDLPRLQVPGETILNVKALIQNNDDLQQQQQQQQITGRGSQTIDSISIAFPSVQDTETENSMRSTAITSKLIESYCDHEDRLLAQMLNAAQLDMAWAKVLSPLCCRAANHFKPEYCSNDLMDIRNYVNFKKVPGGKLHECTIVGGVAFSKNVAHKDMATRVEMPRVLLVQCPIVYERIEGKFVSLSTVLLQEKQYLENVCARIMSFRPNVVLVQKNVAGVAQDMLRAEGITLVLDVKTTVMERLARTLQCDILTSIESNIAKPRLGFCDAFYIRSFGDDGGSYKTLMFFEKLANPRGYTCLLRGGTFKELAKVKRVAAFLVYARYNWRLEMSFLLDEYAQPLKQKPPIFDSKESSPKDENANEHKENEPQMRSPITKQRLQERKSDDKVLTAVTENVTDFTDPLRAANESGHMEAITSNSPDNGAPVTLAVETRYDNRFRSALSSTLLSVSPFLTFPLPYLETESGRKCGLRSLFPTELYYSRLWSLSAPSSGDRHDTGEFFKSSKKNGETQLKAPHPFLTHRIVTTADTREIQTLLAEFRAYGGRYPKRGNMFKKITRDSYQFPQKLSDDIMYKDALDLENHQRLTVLFWSFYLNQKSASTFCAPPTLLDMNFYGQHDIQLGQFLQRYCCRPSNICQLCNLPMLGHVRRYVHSMGCVQVFLTEDHSNDPNRIYFTAWCRLCRVLTPSVPLSETTKCLSFAKYLEMRFHGHAYKVRALETDATVSSDELQPKCQHSLHRDYGHYFSYRGVTAQFQYSPVEVWEVALPPLVVKLHNPRSFENFKALEEIKNFSMRGHDVYARILERIVDLALEDECSPLVTNLKMTASKEQFIFKQHVEIVQTLLTMPKANAYDINDALIMAKRVLAESIELWGPRLHEINVVQKTAAKQMHTETTDSGTVCLEDLQSDVSPSKTDLMRSTQNDAASVSETESVGGGSGVADEVTEITSIGSGQQQLTAVIEKKPSSNELTTTTVANVSDKKSIKKILIDLLPSAVPVNTLQSPFTPLEHYTLPLGAFPVMVHDFDFSSVIAYSLVSPDYQRLLLQLSKMSLGSLSVGTNDTSPSVIGSGGASSMQASPNLKRKLHSDSDVENSGGSSNKDSPSISGGLTAGGGMGTPVSAMEEERGKSKAHNASHINISFHDNGTQFTCKIYFAREFDLMRAKTLEPPKIGRSLYKDLEQSKKREELKVSQSRSGPEIELVRKPSDVGQNSSGIKITTISSTPGPEMGINGDSELETECRQFLARSLSSSVKWEARGGKSGSRFCKTLDDRFVLKEMNKLDISIFEDFAPNYFDYITKCQQQKQPTLLTKIFGVFKVSIKKKDSVLEKAMLVMENLFYECAIENKFDLKGSERNRMVDPSNQNGEIVLQDENFVQMSWSKPLYILSHSKAVLKDAINRDSSFLEKNQVMDYSLLVGLDKKNSLVLGIIDYIRTYTFDKKVESIIKQTVTLGSFGKSPTVVAPERYRLRFIEAMDRYFLTVPDRWEGLSKI